MDTLDDFTLREILALAARDDVRAEHAIRATCRRFCALIGAPISVNIVYVLRSVIGNQDTQTFALTLRELLAEIDADTSLHIHAQADIADNFYKILEKAYCSQSRSNVFAKIFLEYAIRSNMSPKVWNHINEECAIPMFARTLITWNEREIREMIDLYAQWIGLTIDWARIAELEVYDNCILPYCCSILCLISDEEGPLVYYDEQRTEYILTRFCDKYMRNYHTDYFTYLLMHIIAYKYKIHGDEQLLHDSREYTPGFQNLYPLPARCTRFMRSFREYMVTPYDKKQRSSAIETRKLVKIYNNDTDDARETTLDTFVRDLMTNHSFISDPYYNGFRFMHKRIPFTIGSRAFVDDILKRIGNVAQMRSIKRFNLWIAHCLLASWIIEPIIARNYRGLPLPSAINYDTAIMDVLRNGISPREFERGFVQISPKINGHIFQCLILQLIRDFHKIPYVYQYSRIIFNCWHGARGATVVISRPNNTSFTHYLMSINNFPGVQFH